MDKPTFFYETNLPLEIRGFEVNTAVGVFALTKTLDASLELSLKAKGYVLRSDILLSDGQIIDGWVKI